MILLRKDEFFSGVLSHKNPLRSMMNFQGKGFVILLTDE